jgi:hypothetical protein
VLSWYHAASVKTQARVSQQKSTTPAETSARQ